MRQSRRKLEDLLDHIDIGIYVLDAEGLFIYLNDGMVRQSNTTKPQFMGRRYDHFLHEFRVAVSEIVFREKRPVTMFQDIKREHEAYRQLITSTPVFDAEGNICNVIAVVERLSNLEQRLQTAQQSEISKLTYSKDIEPRLPDYIVAESGEMRAVLSLAQQIADVDSPVMLMGESGVGKEVVAQYLRHCSNRKDKPLVDINCASLPESLLEAELFGYAKGAFTGASANGKAGLIETADGGILFLDEINSMPPSLQPKLLRVLETREVRRIGDIKSRKVDFRLITATNKNLEALVREGAFRQDLHYRLNVIPITIPPLRERKADIIPLAEVFTARFCKQYNKTKSFSRRAHDQMMAYDWPGNIRQLRNLVERVVVTTANDVPTISLIPSSFFGDPEQPPPVSPPLKRSPPSFFSRETEPDIQDPDFSLAAYMEQCERGILEKVLQRCKNTYAAARILKIGQSSVVRKKQKHSIDY